MDLLRSLATVAEVSVDLCVKHTLYPLPCPLGHSVLSSIVPEAVSVSASTLSLGPQESLVKDRKMELESCLHISNIVNISFEQIFMNGVN